MSYTEHPVRRKYIMKNNVPTSRVFDVGRNPTKWKEESLMANEQLIGTNVMCSIEGNKMIITVDLTEDHGMSSSGKTKVIATTAGSRSVPTPVGNVLVGININMKK